MELKDLKSEYEKLARKYGLPSFEEIVLDLEFTSVLDGKCDADIESIKTSINLYNEI